MQLCRSVELSLVYYSSSYGERLLLAGTLNNAGSASICLLYA